ncbi:MAG: hypothetical protein HQL29_03405 [Candidatus Omnitrophica bacterium]|nr:hypothetical protein [Candidatus Omnitrophota bacterium]
MNEKLSIDGIIEKVKQQPLYCAFMTIAGISVLCFFMAIFELSIPMPEFNKAEAPERQVIEIGNSFIWLGMEVTPFTRSIRREFDIPSTVKGMYVVKAGKGLAMSRGVLTGDIICSINRSNITSKVLFLKTVKNAKFYDGIVLDIFRNNERTFITVPYTYQHGPFFGPNKGHWQLGAPILNQAFRYSEFVQPQQNKTVQNK